MLTDFFFIKLISNDLFRYPHSQIFAEKLGSKKYEANSASRGFLPEKSTKMY